MWEEDKLWRILLFATTIIAICEMILVVYLKFSIIAHHI